MKREELLRKLQEIKPLVQSRYKVRSLGLFGSWVREEANSESDINLLVEFTPDADLLDWVGLMLYLQDMFNKPVDVVPKHALRDELRQKILRETIFVNAGGPS